MIEKNYDTSRTANLICLVWNAKEVGEGGRLSCIFFLALLKVDYFFASF